MVSGYAAALGFTIEQDADGPLLRLPFGDHLIGRPGFLHGGAVAGLIEQAAAAALRHALGDTAVTFTAVTITIDYRRGGKPVESLAAARVVRLGRRIAQVEVEVWQEDRARPIAAARGNFLLRHGG